MSHLSHGALLFAVDLRPRFLGEPKFLHGPRATAPRLVIDTSGFFLYCLIV
uniref:Uncharacterized protein n=1 Tax=Lepeophtheirus salmonis TaxID=72036 RepID=A0A0K2U6R7_LEPSM